MAERCVKGDYIGFTLGGVHSSELGLMRVSNGSRYEQDLLPPLQDKTAQVAGRDGAIYFGSQYNTKPIKVPVAFDNMTEESFQKLKELIMDKKPKYLWFDETPYKQWLVKAGGLQSFKWVCFDESKNIYRNNDGDSEDTKKRIYKGEGTLEFACFTPYAESRVTFLDDPVDSVWVWNREESPKKLVQESEYYFKAIETKNKQTKIKKCDFIEKNKKNYIIYEGITYDFTTFRTKIAKPKSEEGSFVVMKTQFEPDSTNAMVFFPNDKSSLAQVRPYYIKDKSLLPLSVDDNFFFPAYDLNKGEKKTKIAITGTKPEISESIDPTKEYYYAIDFTDDNKKQTHTSILFYQDSFNNMYWINPTTGYPEYDMPVFILVIKGDSVTTTLQDNYNYNEWGPQSRLKTQYMDTLSFNILNNQSMNIYNAGDTPTNTFISVITSKKENADNYIYNGGTFFLCNQGGDEEAYIKIKPFELGYVNKILENGSQEKQYDDGFIIDSKLKMIKGTYNGVPSGNIYSKNHIGGDYFKIPVCANDEYYIIKSTSENEFTVDYKHYYI